MATKIIVHRHAQSNFSQIANSLWTLPISDAAVRLFGYLYSQQGYIPNAVQIESELHMGKDKRQRAMRELKEVGLAWYEKLRDKDKIVGEVVIVSDAPLIEKIAQQVQEAQENKDTHREREKPAAGKSGANLPDNRHKGAGKPRCNNNTNTNTNAPERSRGGKFAKNPLKSTDHEVERAVQVLADRPDKETQKQIELWLSQKGYWVPTTKQAFESVYPHLTYR